jgi:glutathione S-transferase
MKLFGVSGSPYVRKVLAFADEKGVELELIPSGLGSGPTAEFLRASPFRKMPAFQDGDFAISDSTAIITYLDALKPEPNLIPLEPKARARTIWYEEFADTILTSCGAKIFFNRFVAPRVLGLPGDESVAAAAERDELPPILDYLETVIPPSGWLVEDRLTLADLAVASPIGTLMHLGWRLDPKTHPKAAAYADRVLARPSLGRWIAAERAAFGT